MAKQRLPADKELVIGEGAMDRQLALPIKNGECTKVTALHFDHEEAGTRMLLHAKHAQRVVIQSPDAVVLLLRVTHNDQIECDELRFRTGVKDRLRYIPAHEIAAGVGPLMYKVLPAFHALTGCDSTSALSRVGKKKAWKIIVNSKEHQQHLVSVGQSPDVDSVTATKAEVFICSLYKVPNRIPTSADEARYLLVCQKAQSNLQLPPMSDSPLQHIKGAN